MSKFYQKFKYCVMMSMQLFPQMLAAVLNDNAMMKV